MEAKRYRNKKKNILLQTAEIVSHNKEETMH